MKIKINNNTCKIIKESNDPKFYEIMHGSGESRLLHHIKLELNKQGYDLIKKRMHKDGHLVCDLQQYLRSRNTEKPDAIMIHNSNWAIAGAEKSFNSNGETTLTVTPCNRDQ